MSRADLLARLRERIVAYAASRFHREFAEDLAQETLLVLEEKYADLDRIEDLLPLAFQIVRFKMMAMRRKLSRRGEGSAAQLEEIGLPDPAESSETLLLRRERLELLESSLLELGERCRTLFRWKLAGKSFEEIRALMRADSINTVYTWDFRCRKDLRAKMEAAYGG